MGFLDSYDQYVSGRCQELTQQNSTFEKITESLGVSQLVSGVKSFMEGDIVQALVDSPLRELGEDVLAQTITDNARRLSQNILNLVPQKLTQTLTDVRAVAFNAVTAAITFQNDMALYFAAVVAQECVDAIKDKRQNLLALQEAVRKLHNALLVLAGGGPFFRQYLRDLRSALVYLDAADQELSKVYSSFYSTTVFPRFNYNNTLRLVKQAYALILPPVTGEDAVSLNQGFLKNVFVNPSYGRQLGMLMNIPRLAKEMLGQYDLYAIKVIKVNALLLGFQSTIQNLKEVTGGKFKDLILEQLKTSQTFLRDIVKDMALNVNGAEDAIDSPIEVPANLETFQRTRGQVPLVFKPFEPNPTKTSSKAMIWGVKIKSLETMLKVIDADALQNINLSNAAIREYNNALQKLALLDDRVSSVARLRATDGREQPGELEGDMITFAFQANQAIIDSSLLETQQGRFSPGTVLALGAKLNSRIQLSIDQDREIEEILLRFIAKTKPLLDAIRATGDSIFRLMDDLGMDRASDSLKRGAFGDFFSMNGKTATYVGAAMAGLSAVQASLDSEEKRQCINEAVNKLKVKDTSSRLAAQRAVSTNFTKQQKQNEIICKDLKESQKRVESCSVGLDVTDLKDNPLKSLQGLFRGVFGGDVFDSIDGTFGSFGNFGKGLSTGGIIAGAENIASKTSGVFTNTGFADIASKDAVKAAQATYDSAKNEASAALKKIPGVNVTGSESLDELDDKITAAKEIATGDDLEALREAETSINISRIRDKEANDLLKNSNNIDDIFKRSNNPASKIVDEVGGNPSRFYTGGITGTT